MNRNKRCGAFYTFGRVVGLACVLIVASAAQAGGNQPPATAAQPTAPQVLKAIYGKDSHGESNFDIDQGRYASYWFSYSFSLGGVSYFTGFASTAPPTPLGLDTTFVPGLQATITVATYRQASAGTHSAWSLLGTQSNVGQFGDRGNANEVDTDQTPPSYHTAAGRLVLAIPEGTQVSGEWVSSYELFAFDPHLIGKNAAYWSYLGNVESGEDNSPSCGSNSAANIACEKSLGKVTFVPDQGEDMPAIQVNMSGTDEDVQGHLRNLGSSDVRHYRYDATSKTYKETKP